MSEYKTFMNKNTAADDETNETTEEIGNIRVADEVVSIVASLAAQEIPGVHSMSGGLTDDINQFLGKENSSKGVRLSFDGKVVTISIYVNIEYGNFIPEIALQIQETVKDAVEKMAGYEVRTVDVHVEGVIKREKTELEKAAEEVLNEESLNDEGQIDVKHREFFDKKESDDNK